MKGKNFSVQIDDYSPEEVDYSNPVDADAVARDILYDWFYDDGEGSYTGKVKVTNLDTGTSQMFIYYHTVRIDRDCVVTEV